MTRRLLAAAALLILGALPARAAETFTVAPTTVDDRKAVIATVEPVRELPGRARIGGTITEIKIKEGDRVAAGDRIAMVVDQKMALQLQGLEARIEAQRAARDQAKIEFDRAETLRRSGTGTQAKLDEARTLLDIAERNLKAARSERDVTTQQAAEGAVLAPGAGRILKVPVGTGSVVLPGDAIALIATDSYILRLQLPERHARFIKTGDTILVGARGLQGQTTETLRQGHVALVYPEISQGRVVADVQVDGLGDYFVGERTRVYVATGKREALVLPEDYLYRRFGVSYVRLKDGTELVVQVGLPTDKGIEVLSGLRAGDVVSKP